MTVTDDLWTAVANERRRMAIRALNDIGPTTLSKLSDAVSRREYGPGYTSKERKCVYVSLSQSHLEKLRAAGIITVTGMRHDIQLSEEFDTAIAMLDAAETAHATTKPSFIDRLAIGLVTGVTK